MKKHQLLKKAYDEYPKGTKYLNLGSSERNECESSGSFYVDKFGVKDFETHYFIHGSGKWAEIVKPKIAIKVENEKEFSALMKYYDGLGWKWRDGYDPLHHSGKYQSSDTNILAFNDKFNHLGTNKYPIGDYKTIPFSDFAKENNIKSPLIKSEDGVWLYEGDYCYVAFFMADKWFLDNHTDGGDSERFEVADNGNFINSETEKHFSTKQSSLKWIEAQTPKTKDVKLYFGQTARINISKGEVHILSDNGDFLTKISTGDIKDISVEIK